MSDMFVRVYGEHGDALVDVEMELGVTLQVPVECTLDTVMIGGGGGHIHE